jgi:hypothetical protein
MLYRISPLHTSVKYYGHFTNETSFEKQHHLVKSQYEGESVFESESSNGNLIAIIHEKKGYSPN